MDKCGYCSHPREKHEEDRGCTADFETMCACERFYEKDEYIPCLECQKCDENGHSPEEIQHHADRHVGRCKFGCEVWMCEVCQERPEKLDKDPMDQHLYYCHDGEPEPDSDEASPDEPGATKADAKDPYLGRLVYGPATGKLWFVGSVHERGGYSCTLLERTDSHWAGHTTWFASEDDLRLVAADGVVPKRLTEEEAAKIEIKPGLRVHVPPHGMLVVTGKNGGLAHEKDYLEGNQSRCFSDSIEKIRNHLSKPGYGFYGYWPEPGKPIPVKFEDVHKLPKPRPVDSYRTRDRFIEAQNPKGPHSCGGPYVFSWGERVAWFCSACNAQIWRDDKLLRQMAEMNEVKPPEDPPMHLREQETQTTPNQEQEPEPEDDERTTNDMSAKKAKDVNIAEGDVPFITLPKGMSLRSGIEWLTKKATEEEKDIQINQMIPGYPADALVALTRAMKEIYGFVSLEATPTFFGEIPPKMLAIKTGVETTETVPWGEFSVHGVTGRLKTTWQMHEGRITVFVGGVVKKRDEQRVHALCERARELVKERSIYKGQAIRVSLKDIDPEQNPNFSPLDGPKFIDLSRVEEADLIFPRVVQKGVEIDLYTVVEHTDEARAIDIPIGAKVLLAGPYGTGKSLCAYVSAKKAARNGWTFIYVQDATELPGIIHLAEMYQPAIVFVEDIDRVTSGKRDGNLDEVLNVVDGIESKGKEVLLIFTTNDAEAIHPAFRRAGRIDTIIPVEPPDAEAAAKIVGRYCRGLLAEGTSLTAVGERLAGVPPAFIREVVEKAKKAALRHSLAGGKLSITEQDLLDSADAKMAHIAFAARKPDQGKGTLVRFAEHVGAGIGNVLKAAEKHHNNGQTAKLPPILQPGDEPEGDTEVDAS